ncbi:MAG TPA: TadE/TadG family type IV pilus assembly protein [Candidatus Ozemobacteraceae bacterium]|nr:TadE/TadG family type IV pilus assembly protein [Candidatus Ozemobacteraceae bacterium]
MCSRVRTGQATVELALVLPLFLLLVFAIVDFGRVFHIWSCINLQCVEAAREASKRKNQIVARNAFTSTTHTPLAQVEAAFNAHRSPAMDPANYRNPVHTGIFMPQFDGVGDNATETTVSVGYRVEALTPFIGQIFSKLSGKSEIIIWAKAVEPKE